MKNRRSLFGFLVFALFALMAAPAMAQVGLPPGYVCNVCSFSLTASTGTGGTAVLIPNPSAPYGTARVFNPGTVDAFITQGGSAVTATTSGIRIPAGSSVEFGITGTYFAAITESSSVTLRIWQASGPINFTGPGGSGGGGGGGAVTVADGADVTQGTTGDTHTAGTVVGFLKDMWTALTTGPVPVSAASLPLPSGASTSANQTTGNSSLSTIATNTTGVSTAANQSTANTSLATIATNTGAATPAGTNLIGKVGFDQTTPGTTNGVQVNAALPAGTNVIGHVIADTGSTTAVTQPTASNLNATVVGTGTFATQAAQSGTWNVNNVSGTVSLPTGAATAAKQPALGTAGTPSADVISIQGVASGTVIPVSSGVAQGSTTSGQTVSPIGCRTLSSAPTDTTAQTNIPRCTIDGALVVGGSGSAGTASANVLTVQGAASMTPLLNTPAPATTGGVSVTTFEPGASDNHTNLKNGAGQVFWITAFNVSATVNYIRLYNAATGFNGCNSATNLVAVFHIPSNSTSDAGFVFHDDYGLPFSSGISYCVVSAYGQTTTTNATASAMDINIGYK